ncbi:MAG: hypothetical protein AB4426_15630 [Xenococcaceae cyanobacterium]
MTNSPPDRLDRIEAVLESTAHLAQSNTLSITDLRESIRSVEVIAESNTRSIASLREAIRAVGVVTENNAQTITRLSEENNRTMSRLAERINRFVEQAERDRAAILQMQREIKGLQTENRRILERWQNKDQ